MFISISFRWCIRIFFGSDYCWRFTISIFLIDIDSGILRIFLTLFIFVALWYTSLTYLVCIKRLFHWIWYAAVLKSTIFGMGSFTRCYSCCMSRKIGRTHICFFWYFFWLVSHNPRWIQFERAIRRSFRSSKFIFVNLLTSISCLYRWLNSTWTIFILRILRHVDLVG